MNSRSSQRKSPGSRKAPETLELLRAYESRNVTFQAPDGSWPIVWERARGVRVWDPEGNSYLDLTAAFGVAAAGHANPRIVAAGQRQMGRLLHAMGDVHPHARKAQLVRELSRLTFERWNAGRGATGARTGKTILGNSGFEAVEAALKTARLATGRRGVIAFEGAYHGLGYGALSVVSRDHFRAPFRDQLGGFGHFVAFPDRDRVPVPEREARAGQDLRALERRLKELFRRQSIGAILVEPIQARGGIRVPPPGFLTCLRAICDRHGALLILDEIYTGLGRTGKWFACEHEGVVPDVICLGKALTGGFPLSACVGRADLMDAAWPLSNGEAIHTSTFLGHPVGCAMALAQIAELRRRRLVERSGRLGAKLRRQLERVAEAERQRGGQAIARGLGLMAGLEVCHPDGSPDAERALRLVQRLLQRGIVALPEGVGGEVVGLTPPLTIREPELARAIRVLGEELARC